MKKVPVTNSDKEKSYFKYYLKKINEGPIEKHAKVSDGILDNSTALRIHDRNDLFNEGYLSEEFGQWQLEDGTALIANKTFFPNVTGEMFDWWFAWHPIDRLRYAIWDNEDHYDVNLEDPSKALDFSLSMRERHWGSIHYIWEDIGTGNVDLLKISFKRPSEFGYDESKVDTALCNALICANVLVYGNDKMPDVPVVMTHFLRPVKGGSELRSRFWFGWQIIDGHPVKSIPDDLQIPIAGPEALLKHNIKEFSNLAEILPLVYKEEKDNWI
ncbi:DAPG hydrolase family protein [Alkalibacter mobilis]|uniref:DAPG hydrolase family protein n=1 Tax=Alkalibacter mobilis TaxID=2787712 RepID=UPI00189D908B|nr:phloretin hydrolase [Alkalibacter mobilis]MBF7097253.1 phloretin hydrolase [Alkalibacter mobilis]